MLNRLAAFSLLAAAAGQQPSMVASPPSTLLLPGTTSLPLSLSTLVPTRCAWDVSNVSFTSMANAFEGEGTSHTTTLYGLSGGLTVTSIYVQCAAYVSSPPLVLSYRALPDAENAPFPRLGNLWGSGNFENHPAGLAYAASRASLWLGSTWSASQIAELRTLNPFTIVLTSINACEVNDEDLPDAFYLTNITQPPSTRGRLESWPGAWRLDLTNPDVQEWQAQLMYCLVVYGGTGYGAHPECDNTTVAIPPLVFDGLFVDNVFEDDGAAVNSQDIYHNPFFPINQSTGEVMTDFNEKWRAGMVSMIALFRDKMPHAILDGHAMDVNDVNITGQFNAISIGFTTVEILEGYQAFASGMTTYDSWMTLPTRSPTVTMVESAVRFQLGYGYGFDHDLEHLISHACANSNSVPGAPPPGNGDACAPGTPQEPGYISPQTFMLARSEYRYMRFGFGFTLMRNGYFTHELGDSWHGQDWDYDELHHHLGLAHGNATVATVTDPDPHPIPPPISLDAPWSLYVRVPSTSNATWAPDAAVRPSPDSPPSVRVDILGTAALQDSIDLSQIVTTLESGGYEVSFFAKASASTPVGLNLRKNGGDWHNEGLDNPVSLTTAWAQYNITFVAQSDGAPSRLSWFMGHAPTGSSVWINAPTLIGVAIPTPVYYRTFDCGVVVLNGDTLPHTVELSNVSALPLHRLTGQQAPMWQYFIDDADETAFSILTGSWDVRNYDSGYHGDTTPSQEEVRPTNGFFHHWAQGAHHAPGGSSASFDLRVPVGGVYNVSLWWPAAVPDRATWAQAMRVSISSSTAAPIVVTVDLTTAGGDAFYGIASAHLDVGAVLTVECPAGGGDCIADAVLVESAARWNDGSLAEAVTLAPMDAIILENAC